MLYKYNNIKPTKLVYTKGEPLTLVSSINSYYENLQITWIDELRCVSENDNRDAGVLGGEHTLLIATKEFNGSLFYKGGEENKTVWTWGDVPENTPLDVPCYIRSVQTVDFILGTTFKVVYESDPFTVSEFDYTKQQQQVIEGS